MLRDSSGRAAAKIRVKTVRVNQYVWKCPDRHCPKSRLEGAIKGDGDQLGHSECGPPSSGRAEEEGEGEAGS